ncbi:MAG TPA: NF038129 family PEP-CTERM protein [Candidatus Sulfotelmatobacter sp.]|jgi:hypothetical protein|nr:NF038129 family PEP-CTERM protein [Candidatus Sulfotelmatobacter sp.]
MFKKMLIGFALLFGGVAPAFADGVTYDFTVNTSSVTGQAGSLDFQFNPGALLTQSASLQILNFSSNGTLGSSVLTGDTSGALPGTVLFNNGSGFNDYFTGFTYGSTITFAVNLFGPAVVTPDGVSTSGSTFAFSLFSDPAGTVPVLTSDTVNGFAALVNVNLDGSTTLTNNSSQLAISTPTTPAPEPGSLLLLASGLASLALLMRRSVPSNS